MKILHTADWHVGRTIRGRSRTDEHEEVLAEVAGVARGQKVDFTLVVGDLFDTAAPAPEAERIVYRALLDLADVGPVVVVAGNHDNPRRLLAVGPLLELGQVTTSAAFAGPDEGGVVEIPTASGDTARIALLPFLSQRFVVPADVLMESDAADHSGTYATRMRDLIAHLCAGFTPDAVNIVAAHAMVEGGAVGGGERAAHTVMDYWVSATAFPASTHYAALGHLHRAQRIAGPCPIWYSGSPLQLDFGEAGEKKHVLVIDAAPGRPAEVEKVPLTSGRALRSIHGTLAELEGQVGKTSDGYLRIFVREQARAGLAEDVRALFPDCVDVIIESPDAPTELAAKPARAGRSPHELFAEYLSERQAEDERVLGLFDDLLEAEYAPDPA